MSGKPEEENKGVADFLSFLTKPEMQYFWHKETGYVPITNAAYDLAKSDGYYKSTPDAEIGIQQVEPARRRMGPRVIGLDITCKSVMSCTSILMIFSRARRLLTTHSTRWNQNQMRCWNVSTRLTNNLPNADGASVPSATFLKLSFSRGQLHEARSV